MKGEGRKEKKRGEKRGNESGKLGEACKNDAFVSGLNLAVKVG